MDKKSFKWHGRKYYLLGADEDGINYWIEEGHFDCDWYWGFGYVETFTNNANPSRSKDIQSHSHFNYLFFNQKAYCLDSFNDLLVETPFTEKEIWKLLELMKSFYIVREYADTIYRGGAHITSNPVAEIIQSESEYKRINETVIPAIMNEVYKILEG